MTNDSEDGNGLQYGFLKKMTGCQFFKVSCLRKIVSNMLLQYGISSINCFLSFRRILCIYNSFEQIRRDSVPFVLFCRIRRLQRFRTFRGHCSFAFSLLWSVYFTSLCWWLFVAYFAPRIFLLKRSGQCRRWTGLRTERQLSPPRSINGRQNSGGIKPAMD